MPDDLKTYFEALKVRGLSPEREARLAAELATSEEGHRPSMSADAAWGPFAGFSKSLYAWHDMMVLQAETTVQNYYASLTKSLDELLERDRQREQDGFPRKIQVGRLVKPGRSGAGKVVVVPTTVEEKLIHDPTVRPPEDEGQSGGTGEEQEGEIIGEQPVREDGQEPGSGPGQGEGENHDMESSAYELGRTLTEKFQLPNLKEKGKKRSLTRYSYDLTDKHRGFGQVMDKKATLRKIVESNIALGNIPDVTDIDPSRFLIAPSDKIYRVVSREKDYESQAVIFFLRDYSGSMAGKVTDLVVSQHVLIYSWLLYQYGGQVESRFILHDTEAKEVPDFYTYHNSRVAGGTEVASAYRLVNELVANEDLSRDYNIYVFHGTDGDDWDAGGEKAILELERMLKYTSRVGVTIAEHGRGEYEGTEVSNYLNSSGLLKNNPELLRMDIITEDADEARLIESIRRLIS